MENSSFTLKVQRILPCAFSESQEIELTKEIIEKINNVFNRYGEVKSDASPDLEIIRKEICHARKAIQENFNRALTMYGQSDLLDDIRETIIDDQRVLAVKSGFKKESRAERLAFPKRAPLPIYNRKVL